MDSKTVQLTVVPSLGAPACIHLLIAARGSTQACAGDQGTAHMQHPLTSITAAYSCLQLLTAITAAYSRLQPLTAGSIQTGVCLLQHAQA